MHGCERPTVAERRTAVLYPVGTVLPCAGTGTVQGTGYRYRYKHRYGYGYTSYGYRYRYTGTGTGTDTGTGICAGTDTGTGTGNTASGRYVEHFGDSFYGSAFRIFGDRHPI
jgi:hypothetical protein